jgi:predicted outer membrane repeat protein
VRGNDLVRSGSKQKAFGGALYVGNFKTSIESCAITGNYAASSGGGIHLAGGSASLSIQGNTVFDKNMAGESGTAIYSESGGGITLCNTSSVNFVGGVAASGIAIIKGGLVQYDRGAALQCVPGEQLLQNLSSSAAIFGDWKIDCKQVEVSNNGSKIEYVQNTCKQLMIGISPLHTAPCLGLPLTPPMLMTAGTVSW